MNHFMFILVCILCDRNFKPENGRFDICKSLCETQKTGIEVTVRCTIILPFVAITSPPPFIQSCIGEQNVSLSMKKNHNVPHHAKQCRCRLAGVVTTTMLCMTRSSTAFSVPSSRLARHSPLFSTFEKEMKPTEETMGGSGWLGWMTAGGSKPRGSADVYMRDPEELGGVARSARYSSKDWWHNTVSLPSSGILRDISFPVVSMTSWATFISMLHMHLVNTGHLTAAKHMCVSSTAHSLMVSALGLLLVFRTNSAYQRFAVRKTGCAWNVPKWTLDLLTVIPSIFLGRTQNLGRYCQRIAQFIQNVHAL